MWPNTVMKGICVRARERNQKEAVFRASMYQKNKTRKDKRRDYSSIREVLRVRCMMEDISLDIKSNTMNMSDKARLVVMRAESLLLIAMNDAAREFEVDVTEGESH